jgi:N-acetylmuramoyl-L-alanine amidase
MKPTRVIVHCSATADSGDRIGALEIDKWHREERGWSQIGYHRVIRRTGVIELGRKDNVEGAHTKGHNEDSIGVCYIGTKYPTVEQIRSLLFLYQEFFRKFQIPWQRWMGHGEIVNQDQDPRNNKDCPGIPMGCFRMLLCNFDNHEFELDDTSQIKAFLSSASLGVPKR